MSIKIKKGQVALAAMLLALGAAVFINWYYTSPQIESASGAETTSVSRSQENLGDAQYVSATTTKQGSADFSQFEIERKTAHDSACETLNDIIKDPSSSKAAVNEAQKALSELSTAIKRENDLEILITSKTGSDCVVIIDKGSVKAVVEKGVLSDTVSMQIKELILTQGDFSPENITIFELKG